MTKIEPTATEALSPVANHNGLWTLVEKALRDWVRATGDTMTDDDMRRNSSDRPEPAKPERQDQDAQQGQPGGAGAVAQPGQPATRGRKPLFRN